jgi:hypothetical protein
VRGVARVTLGVKESWMYDCADTVIVEAEATPERTVEE